MSGNSEFGSISFDLPKNQSNVIKVIGVGGGGSNAINHMFRQGIKGVDFIVCNTDSQALQNSPVANKIQLGVHLTEGLGAGANPEVGQQSALESMAEIEKMLDKNTKMVFITAGMGGGTGTGAAPVIAQLAKERDILTVGIVTVPFQFEGKVRQEQGAMGVAKLRKVVDALIVINNNKLREVYGNLGFKKGFSMADEVLATASRGIAEVITHHYTQNIDLKDAKTVLANSGNAIMGSATAAGENRAKDAIMLALDSPLLDDNKITGAKNVLLLIVSGSNEITIDEIGEINDHIQAEAGFNANIIMGVGEDESLGEAIAVTIIATGFTVEQQSQIVNLEPKKIIHALESDQRLVQDLLPTKELPSFEIPSVASTSSEKVIFELEESSLPEAVTPAIEMDLVPTTAFIKDFDVVFEIVSPENHFSNTLPLTEFKVNEPDLLVEEKQVSFEFDLPITSQVNAVSEEKLLFDLSDETKDIKVNKAVEVVPVTEVNENGIIKYSLEEYMELEHDLINSTPGEKVADILAVDVEMTLKHLEQDVEQSAASNFSPGFEEVAPLEMTIEETLRMRADERRRKMKDFNYKFTNSAARIDEIERIPAYKRTNVDLSPEQSSNNNSRMSLGTDSNDDLQLRSNNSFLHDNVD